jgi:hypothetical protein
MGFDSRQIQEKRCTLKTVTAGPTNAIDQLEQAQSRWIPDFAEISLLYRQLTSVIETRWDELPSEFKAWAQLATYDAHHGFRFNMLASIRSLISAAYAIRAYWKNKAEFLEYVENVQRFRRAVMNAVERHDPEFQARLSTATQTALEEISSGKAEVVGSTEEEIREWFTRHRLGADKVH